MSRRRPACAPFTRFATLALVAALAASCREATPRRFAVAPPPAPSSQNGGAGARGGSGALAVGPTAASNVSFAVAQAPLALTSSDGSGLRLSELRAEAIIDGPLAFTEMRLTFENPLDRVLEGTFRITLPQGASLGRFAMKIEGEWQEGEVVELGEARRAYEDFLHRKQDPALMEKSAGNEFSARVFPIPARGTKEIVVSYMHEVHDAPYVLPLRGLPELGVLDVKATVVGAARSAPRLTARLTTPDTDYVVDATALSGAKAAQAAPAAYGVRSGPFAIVRVRPTTTAQPEPITSAVVLVDTSASRALGFEDEVKLVERLVHKLAEGQATVSVAAFDQVVSPVFEGRAADFGEKDLAKLRARGALGASDVGQALAWAREQAKKNGRKRVVLVSDGVATAGATDAKLLAAQVAAMKSEGVERIDALAVGGIRDDAGLRRLVRGQLAHDGIVVDAAADPAVAVRRLGEATRSGIPVKVEGATWAWPSTLDGVQAGDGYSIYAQLPADRPVKVSVDGKPAQVVDLRQTERPLVERGVAQARIASMLEREATTKVDLKKSIVSLAVSERIMTPYTAMLVLETEQDYARFHIDRRSLTDVLAVEDGAVKRVHRTSVAFAKGQTPTFVGDGGEEAELGKVEPREVDALHDSAPSSPRKSEARERDGAGTPAAKPASVRPGPVATRPRPRPARRTAAPPAARAVDQDNPWSARGDAAPRPSPTSARSPSAPPAQMARRAERPAPPSREDRDDQMEGPRHTAAPYEGRFAEVMEAIAAKSSRVDALATARAWQKESPGDVLALVALGEAAEAKSELELAARAYGSVVDLFPNRADLRRFAGERLERLHDASASALAVDTFAKALADRPDHPSSHRLYAFSLLRAKQYDKAFAAAIAGARRSYEVDRFAGVDRILREDIGIIGAAWARAEPARRASIEARVRQAGGRIEDKPSLRFVLDWQTDANDVDFHIHDARGGHAFFSSPHLASGGDLYADVTTGYGPECFTIRLPKERRSTYRLEAHYYSRGPMGYGMGKVEIIDHDGKGNLTFEERPFVVMVDSAYVDLGTAR